MQKSVITELRVHRLRQACPEPLNWCAGRVDSMETNVIEVRTSDGLTGWGDGFIRTDLLEANPELLLGRSPFEAEMIFRETGGGVRDQESSGGLDIALWDLQGQMLGQPISKLFGTVFRDSVIAYASVGYLKDSWPDPVQGFVDDMVAAKDKGFRALKMKTGYGVEFDAKIIRAVREAIGPDVKLCVDSGSPGIYDAGSALGLGRQLQDLNLEFWEEPVEQRDFAGYRRLREQLPIPLAGGEGMYVNDLIEHFINTRLTDVVQPDIERCGFTGGRWISHAAWLNRVRLIPHTWAHTPIRIAATLHWLACWPAEHKRLVYPAEPLLELHPPQEALAWELSKELLEIDPTTGRMAVPTGAGLGLTIKPEVLDTYRIGETFILN